MGATLSKKGKNLSNPGAGTGHPAKTPELLIYYSINRTKDKKRHAAVPDTGYSQA